jgi:hypothetical protein
MAGIAIVAALVFASRITPRSHHHLQQPSGHRTRRRSVELQAQTSERRP